MQLVKGLNKYGYEPNIKKLSRVQFIEEHQELLKKNYIQATYKDEYGMQATLIYLNCLLNKEALFYIYMHNINETRDLWDSMGYQQRQILLHGELMTQLIHLPHFTVDEQLILLPCFDQSMNLRFMEDYQSLLLKQNKEEIDLQLKNLKSPTELYGVEPLKNGFCDFIWLKNIEQLDYLYLEDFKALYVFDSIQKTFIDKCILMDKNNTKELNVVELKEIATLYHHQKQEILLEYLWDHHYIEKKLYEKLKKKYLGG